MYHYAYVYRRIQLLHQLANHSSFPYVTYSCAVLIFPCGFIDHQNDFSKHFRVDKSGIQV